MSVRPRTVSAKSPPKLNWLLIVSIQYFFAYFVSCFVVYCGVSSLNFKYRVVCIDSMLGIDNNEVQSSFVLQFQHVIALDGHKQSRHFISVFE